MNLENSRTRSQRILSIGAELNPEGGVHFRVWAPGRKKVRVLFEEKSSLDTDLELETTGYFSGTVPSAVSGDLYRFQLDGGDAFPDPASRFQPQGPHGPSQVIDSRGFPWTDMSWTGVTPRRQVLYELHLGTFTPEGTWASAQQQLPELASIGITCLEIMPVADFPGEHGWGYDGVDLFAPAVKYGTPDDAKRFINEAHHLGIGVVLDVVYNHFGPDGNYIGQYSQEYFTDRFKNDWGEALNFSSQPVRDFFVTNARYWIEEFHFDGLRLDATQDIRDDSTTHILAEIAQAVRRAGKPRDTFLIAENEPQQTRLVRSTDHNGFGLDALWNDDFHHSATVTMTGRNEAYYADYLGKPQEFISSAKYGYLYQGQWYEWQKARRGTSSKGLKPWNFVNFLQNHDQVANSGRGQRPNLLTSPAMYRAMSALLMLSPGTPMLFQGQEFGATSLFLFFCDHHSELCKKIHEGRNEFLGQFRSLAQPEMQKELSDPGSPESFSRSVLDFSEREKNSQLYCLYKDLIRLRQEDPVFAQMQEDDAVLDGAVLSENAFVLRYTGEDDDRLLLVNLGRDMHLQPAPEPLLAPIPGTHWSVLLSTEDPKYGGTGTFPPDSNQNWRIAGQSTLVLQAMLGPAPEIENERTGG